MMPSKLSTRARITALVGIFSLLAVGLTVSLWWLRRREQPKPNIVIVLVDTLRSDHTSIYGYARSTTPNLERMAAQGLVMRQHFANAPWTKPSVASILTGIHAGMHGARVVKPTADILDEKITLLPETLKTLGYGTYAYINNLHLNPSHGFAQGYDVYHYDPHGGLRPNVLTSDWNAIDKTIATLKATLIPTEVQKPVFVWAHLMSVHGYQAPLAQSQFSAEPKTPIDRSTPQAWRMKSYDYLEPAIADYDNSILFADSLLGRLIEFISSECPNTILVVTSDHGEEFYEHGDYEHMHTLYNELLRVPLVISGPGIPIGEISGLTDSLDIMPTILTLAGFKDLPEIDRPSAGRSLIRDGNILVGKDEVFAEQDERTPWRRRALIRKEGKMIQSEARADGKLSEVFFAPGTEIEVLDGTQQQDSLRVKEFRSRIEQLSRLNQEYMEATIGAAGQRILGEDELRNLKEMGYLN